MNTWRKSTYSSQNGSCVEVAHTELAVGVRDSKNSGAGHLTVAPAQWLAFLDAVTLRSGSPSRVR